MVRPWQCGLCTVQQLQLTINSPTVSFVVNISTLNISCNRRNKKCFPLPKNQNTFTGMKNGSSNTIHSFSTDQLNSGQKILSEKVFFQTEKTFRFHFVVLSRLPAYLECQQSTSFDILRAYNIFFYRIGNNSSLNFISLFAGVVLQWK